MDNNISRHIYIESELVENGELFDYLVEQGGQLSESQVHYIFKQLVSAVEFMHAHEIAHRDIKLENVFLDKQTKNFKGT